VEKKSVTIIMNTEDDVLQGGVSGISLDASNNLILTGDSIFMIVKSSEWTRVVAIPDTQEQAVGA
jgi:hypothetical protein